MENMVYFAEEVNPVFSLVVLVGRVLVSTCKKYWNSAKKPLDVKIMDAPGSSLAPCFYPQKASCNHLRLSQLITLLCGDLFRDILSRYIKPADLRSELDNNKQKLVNIFNKQQQNLIYPATGNTSLTAKDFDISIIYILLRNICNIPSHKAGWGKPPAKGDNSIAAGIEIIRLTRNSILAHSTSGMIEDPVFEAHWKELRDVVIQIETQLTGSDLYKRGVDFLHSCNLTSVGTETCHNEEKSMQDGKRTARFAELFDELAEGVPVQKIARLKDYIQNNCKAEDIASIKQAVSGRDCLRYLRDAKRFTSSDVLFVQYLFKRIDCKEQFAKCYEYAEKQDALCFYEKPPAYGYKNVQFHVKGNLSEYSSERIAKIIENLAVLLNCTSEEILIEGACPSSSFLLVLSIKEAYLCKLLALEQCDKDKLTKLDIDYYIVDLTVIHLEPSKEFRWNIYFDPKHFDLKKYENILSQEEKSTVSPSQHMASVFKEKESSPDEDSEDSNSTPVPQEESQLIYQRCSNEDIKFHSFHGSDILLKENGTLAIRHCMIGDGICLTNRPLKIGEKVHIRIVTSFDNYITDHSSFNYINIGTTSIPPEMIFGAKNVKEAVMGRLNYIKTPCQCYYEGIFNRWFAHPLHICISLCRNGSLLVCCEDTEKYYPPYPDHHINTPLWLVIDICYRGSVWISHA